MHDPIQPYAAACREPAAVFSPGSAEEKAALERFSRFFGQLTEANARELTRETYAERFFFHDTLKVVTDRAELEAYFIETARNTESVEARVEDVARSESHYYLRWTMNIRLKKFRRGQTLRSIGLTHLRFNPEGRIVLHQDYWDASAGFFQHVPVLGSAIRAIRRMF